VNDGRKEGTDGGSHRPKPSHSNRSRPSHTDTLSVSELKTGIPKGSCDVPLIPETHCPAVGFLLFGRPMASRQKPGKLKFVVVYEVVKNWGGGVSGGLALIDKEVRALPQGSRRYWVSDGGGLLLEVDPAGGKDWLWRHRFPPTKDGRHLDGAA
jgi:hypothetical protein